MQQKPIALLVALSISFVTLLNCQPKHYNIVNGFGILGGVTYFDIITDNFQTKSNAGWMGGMSATVDIPHRWYNVSYVMQLSENNIDIYGNSGAAGASDEAIEFKTFTAQIALLANVKIIGSELTLDAGPMLQYNSEFELNKKEQAGYFITNYTNLTADEIKGINKFNANGTVGLTLGYDSFKAKAQYIYGFMNMFNKLNSKDLDTSGSGGSNFKGNQSMLTFTLMFTF